MPEFADASTIVGGASNLPSISVPCREVTLKV